MSKQPRKQRNDDAAAPLHERHEKVRATLADDLRDEYGQRNVRVNEGDTVEVLRGDFAGETGEVVDVDLSETAVRVEDVTVEAADGEEVPRPVDASNLRVTDLTLEDDRRQERLESEEDSA
ncbi:50S ribosomal protein L24 [Halosimplex rubrum]|uniref:Large ribosomal subunit protein uL24 n=1 Tax=Halosimplex rubrum TaxID=869889 RepID=A0A7D5SR02_9EURY|nr:50S ribosomal protein L24 [Halosimplex rubrum]QLH78127.1 50S ribosomal protein L24 [Halosimplex rubrum]